MDFTTVLLIIVAILFILLAYQRHDGSLMIGLRSGGQTFLKLIPLFIAVFIIVGLSEVLVPKELVSRWLGEQSGWRGILLASGLGMVMPPSIFVSFPLAATLYKAGAGIGAGVAFVTSWSLLTLFRMPLEVSIVGLRPTLIRMAVGLIFPVIAGFMADFLFGA
ncbi:MAG: permease [Ardenticatenaceae bacterium]|nr:permease [Ardenticatenaceae bacterium]